MPLSSPEDYVKLGEHLKEIDDIFQHFLHESKYADNTGALGRYPHRSAVLYGRISRKIDLQMEGDSGGCRFRAFFPDVPYTLWAGAWLDEADVRFTAPRGSDANFVVFERLPFSRVRTVLGESLRQAARRLSVVTVESLREFGIQTKIGKS